MPPPVPTFPAHSLANAVQTTYDKTHDTQLRLRKDKINLKACKLLEMVQYECGINTEGLNKDTMVQCYPIVRLFRRCQDRTGTFMVETTEWEDGGEEHSR